MRYCFCVVSIFVLFLNIRVARALDIVDQRGYTVTLPQPAKRIVALAPHIVENLYAIGAGELIVGAVEYADYPPAALDIPRVGAVSTHSLEAILALKPDVVIAWVSAGGEKLRLALGKLGIPVYLSEPHTLEDIAQSLTDLGKLTGKAAAAEEATQNFNARLFELNKRYAGKSVVSVFYQIWHSPLQTINGQQIISDIIRRCGGGNIFADAPVLAPIVGIESVLERNPQIIMTGLSDGQDAKAALNNWQRWQSITAVEKNNLYGIPADLISRHTPRILDGAAMLCEHLDSARSVLTELSASSDG